MIGVGLTVPIACWRKGAARELLETEPLPPPATCYGALLSLVGESDRERHRGCRVSVGILNRSDYKPQRSTILRTLWRIKDAKTPQGNKENARPDFQQLIIDARLLVWCDSDDENDPSLGLEERVRQAMRDPSSVERFGGWSLGESTHLINDAWLFDGAAPSEPYRTFLVSEPGELTFPVWVDHVGSAGTKYAMGRLEELTTLPPRERLPQIPFAVVRENSKERTKKPSKK
jgi:CRISPR-associated protein Cas5t